MEIKISIKVSRGTKPVSRNTINAYKNICLESERSELPEKMYSLQQGFLDLNCRLRHLEKKLRRV